MEKNKRKYFSLAHSIKTAQEALAAASRTLVLMEVELVRFEHRLKELEDAEKK